MRRLSFSNAVGEFPKRLLALFVVPSVEEVKLEISLPEEDTRTMRDFLPARLQNFPHLLEVDSLKLDVPRAHCNIQFGGPGGVISIGALRTGTRERYNGFQSRWLESLDPMSIVDVRDLTLRNYHPRESLYQCPVFKSLETLDRLRSLVVKRCNNTAVIKALSPTETGHVPPTLGVPHVLAPDHGTDDDFPRLDGDAAGEGSNGVPPQQSLLGSIHDLPWLGR